MKEEENKGKDQAQGQIQELSPINAIATRVPDVFAMSDDEFWQLIGEFCSRLPLNEDVIAQLRDRQPVMTLHLTKGHIMPGSGVPVEDDHQAAKLNGDGDDSDDLTPLCDG